MIINAEEIIKALGEEGGEIDCSGCIVEGNLEFFNLPEEKDLETGETVINIMRPIKFHKTVFKGKISTWDPMKLNKQPPVTFSKNVNFAGACFEDHVNFDGAIFEENATFGGAHFHKMASFTEATFNKSAGFRSTQFEERTLFTKTVFEDRTDFTVATFNGITFFAKSKFRYKSSRGANFLFTRFNGLFTYFSEAQFNSTAQFIGTTFHGPIYFSGSTFENQAWFAGGCRFDDDVSFKGSNFSKSGSYDYGGNIGEGPPVLFSGVVFSGNAIFSNVQFNQVAFCEVDMETDMGMDTIFRKKADFRRATFETLDLQRVIFESNVDFSNADFGERVDFSNVDIERATITLRWDQLCEKENEELLRIIKGYLWDGLIYGDKRVPKFEWEGVILSHQPDKYLVTDSQACCDAFVRFLSSLERNFKNHGLPKDAATARFLAKETKTRIKSDDSGLSYQYLVWVLSKYIYGYGVRWLRYVVLSILVIFGSALLYMRRNVLQHDKSREKKLRLCISINDIPTDLDKFHGKRKKIGIKSYCIDKEKKVQVYSATKIAKLKSFSCRFWHGFWLSVYVFTKIGYGDVYVRGNWYKRLVILEWLLGYILGALLFLNLISGCEPLSRLVTMFI